MKFPNTLIAVGISMALAGCEPNPESTRTTSVARVASNGLWVPNSKLCDYDKISDGYRDTLKESYEIQKREIDKSIKVYGGNNVPAYGRAYYYNNLRIEEINQVQLRTLQAYGAKCPQPLHPDYPSDLEAFKDIQGDHAKLAAEYDARFGFSREQAEATSQATNDFLASLSAAAAPSGYAAASGSTTSTQPLYAADNAAGCYKIGQNPARHINTCSSDIIIRWKNSANSSCRTTSGCSLTISANSQRSDDPGNLPTSIFGVTRCFESDWARGLCKL